jgi:Mg2+ and Co2+ transporter CorA
VSPSPRRQILLTVIPGTGARFLIQHFNDFRSIDEAINHKWRDIIVFTNWVKATKKTKILFLRTDTKALERIMAEILENLQRSPTSDPLWPYITIIDDYLNLQHKATYAIRDLTEAQEWRAEMPADSRQLEPKTDYTRLHEISRHALTVTEILKVNIKTLGDIVKYHGEFMEQERSNSSSGPDVTVRKTHQRFLLYAHMVHSICCRCSSYRDRMKNEIQLAFNVVSQDEAHTSVEIAKATKADSQAMKLTSLVALVFLPPTFLSAIFSTTFFEFGADENSWGISKKFYLYWVLAIPITIASVFLWYLYIFNSVVVISTPKFLGKRISKARCVDIEN